MRRRLFGRFFAASLCVFSLSGCVTTERVRFGAGPGQTALQRDGRPAVSSVQRASIAILSTYRREIPYGGRVAFVLGLHNRSGAPMDFRVEDISVIQAIPGRSSQRIEVFTFERLQQEERNRQVAQAILVGLAAGANAAAAANAGHYRSNTTIYTPRGTVYATTTGYSPGLAAAAQANAAVQNAAMVDAAVAQGQANMARLENEYIKDHTLLPGEWYGGVVAIEPPVADDERSRPKTYTMRIRVGGDVHVFEVTQEPIRQ